MTVPPPHRPRPSDFRIVDLFAGPGGLDIAAAALGVPSVGIEWDDNACATRSAAKLDTKQGDVRTYRPRLSEDPDLKSANVLTGGPPCQTFTVAGAGAGRRALDDVLKFVQRLVDRDSDERIDADLALMDDVRTGLVLEPLRWALAAIDRSGVKPYDAIVLEQVPAVLPVWRKYAQVLEDEGYRADCAVLHTEEYGVPQTRRRAVMIARRDGLPAELPSPTHHRYRKGEARPPSNGELETWVSMADALHDLRGRPFQVISNYGTGGDPKLRGRRRSCEPSATVTGKNSRNRLVADDSTGRELDRFTTDQAGRLQSFPMDYPWSGRDVAQQIGNAVPPRLGVHVLCAALGLGAPGQQVWDRLKQWPLPSEELDSSALVPATSPVNGEERLFEGAGRS